MLVLADAIDLDALHLRSEFLDMPGLVINDSQVARLLGVPIPHAIELLDSLEKEGFLMCGPTGAYRRASPSFAKPGCVVGNFSGWCVKSPHLEHCR